ncbi:hypothetical protein Tco_0714236 [Tanacetum coccineum]
MDSILEDSIDEGNLAGDLVDTIPEMFTDEDTLDYSSPSLYDDLVELESDNDDVYDDPFDFKEDKIKESKLLIDEPDPLDQVISFFPPSVTRFSMRIFPSPLLEATPDEECKKKISNLMLFNS